MILGGGGSLRFGGSLRLGQAKAAFVSFANLANVQINMAEKQYGKNKQYGEIKNMAD